MKALLHSLHQRWSHLPRWVRVPVLGFAAISGLSIVTAVGVYDHFASEAARVDMDALTRGQDETMLLDARGEIIGSVGEAQRELVRLEDVSPLLIKAIIATEDARFYSHQGFDPVGLARAAMANFSARSIRQGGSTITQQLARNAFGLQERNYHRKIKEIFLAMRIENTWSKDEILTHYINRIYLGHGFYGVGAAARGYFGKDVSDLNLTEAATLAAIIKAPVSFSPISHPDLAKQKRDLTLGRMADTGVLAQAEATQAMESPVIVKHDRTRVRTGYTLSAARSEFLESGAKPGAQAQAQITLRLDWQRKLDEMTRRHLSQLDDGPAQKLQSAVLVLDNRSGQILAMQGGRDFVSSPFNRALDGRRPAGTAFLPLVYATTFTVSSGSVREPIFDAPLDNRQAMIGGRSGTLGEWGEESGSVTYTGTIQPVQALLEARTAATVRMTTSAGLDKVHDWMQRWIVSAPLRKEAAFALGQSYVSPLEMARAFTAIANDGRPCPQPSLFPTPRTNIGPVFTPTAAKLVRETMLTSMSRPEYRRALAQHGLAGRGIAGFGGIAYGGTDAWFVGFDRHITCVVWVGHDKDKPMPHAASVAALPLWAEVFSMVTNGQPESWKARHMNATDIAVVRRATPVADDEVPAIVPASAPVIGYNAYSKDKAGHVEVAQGKTE